MATVSITTSFQRGKKKLEIQLTSTTVPASAGLDTVIPVEGMDRLYIHLYTVVAALTGFSIKARASGYPQIVTDTLYSTAADFLNPRGLLVGCSGDLTTLSGDGWFILDVTGIDTIVLNSVSGGASIIAIDGGGS